MAYPIADFPLNCDAITAVAPSSTVNSAVAVPFRSKLLQVQHVNNVSPSAALNAFDVTVNGTTAAGLGALAGSTAAFGASGSVVYTPSTVVYLNAGDVLATVGSSQVSSTFTYVIRAF